AVTDSDRVFAGRDRRGRRLVPACLRHLAHVVCPRAYVQEGIVAVGIGLGERLTGVKQAVVVEVQVDGPVGQPRLERSGDETDLLPDTLGRVAQALALQLTAVVPNVFEVAGTRADKLIVHQ